MNVTNAQEEIQMRSNQSHSSFKMVLLVCCISCIAIFLSIQILFVVPALGNSNSGSSNQSENEAVSLSLADRLHFSVKFRSDLHQAFQSIDKAASKKKFPLSRFPECSWSGHDYLYPYWDNAAFENTIKALNGAGIVYILAHGGLIGAYRHGGPVPCDGDLDIVFPVWLNGLANCEDAQVPILRDYDKKDESLLTICGKTRTDYVVLLLT